MCIHERESVCVCVCVCGACILVELSRNRLPNHFDDLGYWSDVFLWREQHYKSIANAYDGASHTDQVTTLHHYYITITSLCITIAWLYAGITVTAILEA